MPTVAEIDAQIAELQKKRTELEESERKAAMAGSARRAIALLAAMRQAMKEIESLFPGSFSGEKWEAIGPQAWPRTNRYKNAGDLSDTEVHNAAEAGKKAIAGIK